MARVLRAATLITGFASENPATGTHGIPVNRYENTSGLHMHVGNFVSSTFVTLATVLLSIVGFPAHAALVSVTGGFSSFDTLVFKDEAAVVNGNRLCPDVGCDFNGPAHLDFAPAISAVSFVLSGQLPNMVQFTPAASQQVAGVGNEFLLGTFTFVNGILSGDVMYTLNLTTQSSDPLLDGHVFSDQFTMKVTAPNDFINKTPEENADFFYFPTLTHLGSIRLYELEDSPTHTNTSSVDFFGQIGSLDPTRFANPTGAVFLDPSVDTAPSVPEPSSLALMLIGLLAVIQTTLRQKRSA